VTPRLSADAAPSTTVSSVSPATLMPIMPGRKTACSMAVLPVTHRLLRPHPHPQTPPISTAGRSLTVVSLQRSLSVLCMAMQQLTHIIIPLPSSLLPRPSPMSPHASSRRHSQVRSLPPTTRSEPQPSGPRPLLRSRLQWILIPRIRSRTSFRTRTIFTDTGPATAMMRT
jgi:hypothetical protein